MQKLTVKEFTNKLLSGAAVGIVVGLIPSAIFGEIFKALLPYGNIFKMLSSIVTMFQFCVPALIGMFVALSFRLSGIQVGSVVAASFVGSGVATLKEKTWVLLGTGDIINTILTAAIAVLIIRFYGDRLQNLAIVILPTIGALIPGLIGLTTLPFVKKVTLTLGAMISNFTTLQPLLMMILIAISYALIVPTPVSTVAISLAISISGLGAGAANVGVVATLFTFMYGAYKAKNPQTSFALFFAGPKYLMANFLQNPIMILPIAINSTVLAFIAYLIKLQGTPASAGFGITGFAGPINGYSLMSGEPAMKLLLIVLQYLVAPLIITMTTHAIFTKLKLYSSDIFRFDANLSKDK